MADLPHVETLVLSVANLSAGNLALRSQKTGGCGCGFKPLKGNADALWEWKIFLLGDMAEIP